MMALHLRSHFLLACAVTATCFLGCKKDKLIGNLDRFQGRFVWVYSKDVVRNCALCSNFTTYYYDANSAAYKADVELDDQGKIMIYIDDEIFIKKSYKIEDTEEVDDWIHLEIKIDVKTSDLDINDRLKLTSVHPDTIIIDAFPGKGYDVDVPRNNYFVRRP